MQDESLELVRLDARLKELEQENHTLHRQLEKIGKLGGGSGSGANTPGRLSPANITTSDGIHKVSLSSFLIKKYYLSFYSIHYLDCNILGMEYIWNFIC